MKKSEPVDIVQTLAKFMRYYGYTHEVLDMPYFFFLALCREIKEEKDG